MSAQVGALVDLCAPVEAFVRALVRALVCAHSAPCMRECVRA